MSATMNRLQIPKGVIEGLTGIKERRFFGPGATPSEVATLAAKKVIEESGIDPNSIGCLINTSVCRDYLEPSVACLVHGNLKLSPHCLNYDVTNACLGFLNGMNNIIMMIETGLIQYGLIVDGENSREVVEATLNRLQAPNLTKDEFFDNFATLTLGSGAVAMLLAHRDVCPKGHRVNGFANLAATEHSHLTYGQRDHMKTDALGLLNAGAELAGRAWKVAAEELDNWSDEAIDLYAPHQVSVSHMEAVRKVLGISREKVFLNLFTLGNMGPAAIPITMKMAEEQGRLKRGDHVALLGIGSGLNCAGMSITW